MSGLSIPTTDEGVVNALRRFAVIYARRHDLDLRTLSRMIRATIAVEAAEATLPPWAVTETEHDLAQIAPIARNALQAMLASPPEEGLHAAAADAIAEELSGRAQMVDPVLVHAGTLVALAILSKLSWSSGKGFRVESGFPGLDKVLAQLSKIIAKLPND